MPAVACLFFFHYLSLYDHHLTPDKFWSFKEQFNEQDRWKKINLVRWYLKILFWLLPQRPLPLLFFKVQIVQTILVHQTSLLLTVLQTHHQHKISIICTCNYNEVAIASFRRYCSVLCREAHIDCTHTHTHKHTHRGEKHFPLCIISQKCKMQNHCIHNWLQCFQLRVVWWERAQMYCKSIVPHTPVRSEWVNREFINGILNCCSSPARHSQVC